MAVAAVRKTVLGSWAIAVAAAIMMRASSKHNLLDMIPPVSKRSIVGALDSTPATATSNVGSPQLTMQPTCYIHRAMKKFICLAVVCAIAMLAANVWSQTRRHDEIMKD